MEQYWFLADKPLIYGVIFAGRWQGNGGDDWTAETRAEDDAVPW